MAFWNKKDKKKPAQIRNDGWVNNQTGLGVSSMDKAVSSFFARDCRLSDPELSDLYNFSDICAKIIELRPEEMFRVGYDVAITESPDAADPSTDSENDKNIPVYDAYDQPVTPAAERPDVTPATKTDPSNEPDRIKTEDQIKQLEAKGKELDVDCKVLECMCWGRAYGGALLFIGADDGKDPKEPLDDENPGEIKFLMSIDRRDIWIYDYYNEPLETNFGKPKTYMLNPHIVPGSVGFAGVLVHESRCIRFDGAARTDRRKSLELAGWTYSVLQRVYAVVRDFEGLFRSMGYMVQDANQSVFKLSGLLEQIASNSGDLQARMQIVENTRAVNRAVLLDADEEEDFVKVQTTFSGVDAICDRFQQRLSAATGIPVTLLMGRSPAGLNATGDADLTSFYNSVARDQENELKPRLLKLYRMFARSMDIDPNTVNILCRPLIEMTEKERAELEQLHEEKDVAYIQAGVLTAEEVAISRFGDPEEFGLRIRLNRKSLEARYKSLEMALENPDFSGSMEAKGLGPDGQPLPPDPNTQLKVQAQGEMMKQKAATKKPAK